LDTFGEAYEDFVSAVYVAAIRLGTPTRSALRDGDLDDEAVSVATKELVARGLLASTEDPDTWQVVPPRDALPRYAESVERRMETTRTTATEVDALWRRAVGDRPTHIPSDVEMITGVAEVAYRISSLHSTAARRLWWAVDSSLAARQLLREVAARPHLLTVREGVERRLALDTSLLEDADAMAFVERIRAEGHPVAFGHGIPFSVVVADTSVAIVDLTALDQDGEGSFEVRMRPPVRALIRLFEAIWVLATPYWQGLLDAPRTPDRLPLAERDQRILALLTTGASDQVIARQTGVSVRTVERRVRYLMDRLGAATRFQAGVQAARRGWV
jgi:DNA-binding CsgD family transcriptional regulator